MSRTSRRSLRWTKPNCVVSSGYSARGTASEKVRCCAIACRHSIQELICNRTAVDVDTFANNRLSVTLLKDCPIGYLADLMSTEVANGGNVLLEHLTDPRTRGSYHPAKAPLMHALKGPENEDLTFFDWLRNTVSLDLARAANFAE